MKKLFVLLFTITILFACKKEDKDFVYTNGTYKAIEAEYSYGWKAIMQIEIDKDKLASIEFDYQDGNGNKKSETTATEYPMDPHPSTWLPQYETSLQNTDICNYSDIDAVSGATNSCALANKMMKALLEAAKTGDTSEQVISAE
jgi:major membrane immunogen (membrane-anchored lipoprotein)